MLHYGGTKSNETLQTAGGTTDVVHLTAQQPEHLETWQSKQRKEGLLRLCVSWRQWLPLRTLSSRIPTIS